jgi:hypothetical protein
MRTTNLKKFSVTLAMLFSVAACSTPNQTVNKPSQNLNSNSSVSNIISGNVASKLNVSTSSKETTNDLTSYSDEEAIFSDSEKIAEEDSSFSVKALGDLLDRVKNSKAEKANASDKPAKEAKITMRARLETSGAITKNTDGSVIVDKTKLKTTVKDFIKENKADLQERLDKVKEKLKERKEVAKEKIEKLKNKKANAKKSNVVETTNADGSISKTMTVELSNNNMTRENTITKTTKDGKLITISHVLKVTAKNFTKNSSRVKTLNEDGSKQVVTESITTWTDGRKREVHETRNIDSKGEGTGTGTITITDKDGKVTTKSLDTKINLVAGEEKVVATVKEGETTVTLDNNASSTATLSIKEGESTTTTEVEVETAAEAS